jgi:phage/plasmid-like protein (TIGR03299 family)
MPASLFGERYIGMRVLPWHQLGITLSGGEQITAVQAFQRADLFYRYHTLPIGVTLPNGDFVSSTGESAVYREPTVDDPNWRNLGVVSKGYSYLQNVELAKGIDAISQKTGWEFESAGALGQGETIFVCLKTGKHSIKGDEVDSYFLVSDGKAANRALRIAVTPVRVVCQNTLLASDANSSLAIRVPHTVGVEEEYAFWLDLISSLERSQENAFTELRAMAETKITDDIARRIFLDAFPEPVKNQRVRMSESIPVMIGIDDETKETAKGALSSAVTAYEYNMNQSRKWNEGALELYQRFNTGNERGGAMSRAALESLQGTAYAALQAVTELCDYGGQNRDSVASATLFGGRAAQKSRAWSSALRVANANLN